MTETITGSWSDEHPDAHDAARLVAHAAEVFAERGLDLTKIESRPTRHELGDYRFLVDVAGHLADDAAFRAAAGWVSGWRERIADHGAGTSV